MRQRESPCADAMGRIFVYAHMSASPTTADLLDALAEPTRLRILNCLAAAPLFVSDLQAVLGVPQPTVSRHLKVLKEAGLVRDTPIAQFVLYRLRREPGAPGPSSWPPRSKPSPGRADAHRAPSGGRPEPGQPPGSHGRASRVIDMTPFRASSS